VLTATRDVAWLTRIALALRSVLEVRALREAEILALRQQLLVLSRKRPRVRLRNIDRLILVWLCRMFPSLGDTMVIVKPETVLRWHRRGFRAYWRWKSSRCGGRPGIDAEVRALIRRMTVQRDRRVRPGGPLSNHGFVVRPPGSKPLKIAGAELKAAA